MATVARQDAVLVAWTSVMDVLMDTSTMGIVVGLVLRLVVHAEVECVKVAADLTVLHVLMGRILAVNVFQDIIFLAILVIIAKILARLAQVLHIV